MNTIDVRIKYLESDIEVPIYKTIGAAGVDISSIEDVYLLPNQICKIRTGICLEIPDGFEAQLRPRSGLAANHGITVLNSPGTIDSDYRGELIGIMINHSKVCYKVSKGERIAQLVFAPVTRARFVSVDNLSVSERGEDGFGSTGR